MLWVIIVGNLAAMNGFWHSYNTIFILQIIHQLIDTMQKANEVGYRLNLNPVPCKMSEKELSNLVNFVVEVL